MTNAVVIKKDLRKVKKPGYGKTLTWFFKTKKGEYGFGDKFIGVTVPACRLVAKKYKDAPLSVVKQLLSSTWHEDRLVGLEILVMQYEAASLKEKKQLYSFFIKEKSAANNWDLVDLTAPYLVGDFWLQEYRTRKIWVKKTQGELLKSKRLWDRRIGVVSTWAFIRTGIFEPTLFAAATVLKDKEDLMHKAAGWMLREVGKKNPGVLQAFLETHKDYMPRTMLRYAIERFTPETRAYYMRKAK